MKTVDRYFDCIVILSFLILIGVVLFFSSYKSSLFVGLIVGLVSYKMTRNAQNKAERNAKLRRAQIARQKAYQEAKKEKEDRERFAEIMMQTQNIF